MIDIAADTEVKTPQDKKRPHISPSQISMYSRCGEQFRRRYLAKDIVPPGVALIKGSAVHKGIETNNEQKMESWADLPKDDIVEAAVSTVKEKVKNEGLRRWKSYAWMAFFYTVQDLKNLSKDLKVDLRLT